MSTTSAGDNSPNDGQSSAIIPPSSPSPDVLDALDPKISRKREREVSLEPTTPQATNFDSDGDEGPNNDKRERPLLSTPRNKKNRVHKLDPTHESQDEDASNSSGSPTPAPALLSISPPHEVKMRQISQGLEDIDMKRGMKILQQRQSNGDESESAVVLTPELPLTPPAEEETQLDDFDGATPPDSMISSHHSLPSIPALGRPIELSRRASQSDSDVDQDKKLKRKLGDRAVSQEPADLARIKRNSAVDPLSTTKRPREDAEKDDNPRETKRPSPPPPEAPKEMETVEDVKQVAEPVVSQQAPAPKLSGFMAYASTSSPFASVKGANIFSSKKPSSPSSTPFRPNSPLASPEASSSKISFQSSSTHTPMFGNDSPSQTPAKRTGFEAFASSTSPFASATRSKSPAFGSSTGPANSSSSLGFSRSKSPSRRSQQGSFSNAFSNYASGGAQAFAVPASKRARADSPASGNGFGSGSEAVVSVFDAGPTKDGDDGDEDGKEVSFGERLRASKDQEKEAEEEDEWNGKGKCALNEQELTTGEEDEQTVFQVRGKLFVLSPQNAWKERGTGTLRLNVRREDGSGARLVMRKEAVYAVILNITLFRGMKCSIAADPRYLKFSAIEDGKFTHYNLRVQNAKIAQDLLEEISANIPDA
ncbi:hypothetical protein JAAARDRAFT_31318 [Jaapia argillacea MUCL 33604]|uniref:RanBD1 domain-containing protein n=1 Tax=Jaapia argillacea MUCL 33604 TaxID=933084 RepID=A0A067Q447_9AGAM|nr:hypothetical protein JAAARDRAFT_31318 [Jaapia argillacea MUCL 33604]